MEGDRFFKKLSSAPRLMKRQPRVQKYRSMADILKNSNSAVVNDADISCVGCGSGGTGQQLILCATCNQPYHRHCRLSPGPDPTGPLYCSTCRSNLFPPSTKGTNVEESSKGKAIDD